MQAFLLYYQLLQLLCNQTITSTIPVFCAMIGCLLMNLLGLLLAKEGDDEYMKPVTGRTNKLLPPHLAGNCNVVKTLLSKYV